VLARRDALLSSLRHALSERITTRLLALGAYRGARCVMAYASFGSELDTAAFLADVLAQGKKLVLPRVERGNRMLQLHAVGDPARQLAPGVWGIPQPRADVCPPVPASELEFVLVPGVAFTRRGERLGYGGGYYDGFIRSLARRPPLVAAAFELQLLPELPSTDRDQAIDLVVTEDAVYGDRHSRGGGYRGVA
jgi:5-formyltetrahydrofolate cyclo-ligase